MQVLILILILVAVAVLVGAVLLIRRKRVAPYQTSDLASPADTPDTPAPAAPGPAPMSDLESALAQVTDRTGRPIGDRIDAETEHVDELRVPDDTGPLLRRALDHVVNADRNEPAHRADDDESTGDEAPHGA